MFTPLHKMDKVTLIINLITNNLKTKIIVITASSKGEHKVKCLNRGANMFLQKDTGWQDELVKFISTN